MDRTRNNERERSVFSASSVLDEVGQALTTIRREDKLTFGDMGAIMGVSEDQAAKYCAGSQAMGLIAYARAKREWRGRFTGGLKRLCKESAPAADDRDCGTKVIKAALAISQALEDGTIDAEEVRANRRAFEDARDAIEAQLAKLVRPAA